MHQQHVGGVKRRQVTLARFARTKRRPLGSTDATESLLESDHTLLQTSATSIDDEKFVRLAENLLQTFRRTVVVPNSRLAHLPGQTLSVIQVVAPVRVALRSQFLDSCGTMKELSSLRQAGTFVTWMLPTSREDVAIARKVELQHFVSVHACFMHTRGSHCPLPAFV